MAEYKKGLPTELKELINKADKANVRSYIRGQSLAEMKKTIACTKDERLRECLESLLKIVIDADADDTWNCDDTATVEGLFHVHSADLYSCIRAYCALRHPNIKTTSEGGSNLRIRFHPEGCLGMSITSWAEIALVRYKKPPTTEGYQESSLCYDQSLGYKDVCRFAGFKGVCAEITRVDTQLRQRRQQIAASKQLREVFDSICAVEEFKSPNGILGAVWRFNDEGICIELAPGVEAQVKLDKAAKKQTRRRGGRRANGRKKGSGARRTTERKGGLSVSCYNSYSMDFCTVWKNGRTSAEAFELLLTWQKQHVRRAQLFNETFSQVLNLSKHTPGAFSMGGGCTARVTRRPRGRPPHEDTYLIEFIGSERPLHNMSLWATVVCTEEGEHAIVMHRKCFDDDSYCGPDKYRTVIRIPLRDQCDVELYDEIGAAMKNAFANQKRALDLLYGTFIAREDAGIWKPYDRKESFAAKEARSKTLGTPIEFMTSSDRDKMYLCGDYNVHLYARYTSADWGVSLGTDEGRMLVKTREGIDELLASCLRKNEARNARRQRKEDERARRLTENQDKYETKSKEDNAS